MLVNMQMFSERGRAGGRAGRGGRKSEEGESSVRRGRDRRRDVK